jgi:hypothetical protein
MALGHVSIDNDIASLTTLAGVLDRQAAKLAAPVAAGPGGAGVGHFVDAYRREQARIVVATRSNVERMLGLLRAESAKSPAAAAAAAPSPSAAASSGAAASSTGASKD